MLLNPVHPVDDTLRMTMCRVHDQDIDACLYQCLDPLLGATPGTDGGPDTQLSVLILAGIREVCRFLDILDRDHAA